MKIQIILHLIEITFAIFVGYMSLKFFRITRPLGLFLLIYIGIGFYIISSLMYLLYYYLASINYDLSFSVAYLTSRISLIGMAISFALFFHLFNKELKQIEGSKKQIKK